MPKFLFVLFWILSLSLYGQASDELTTKPEVQEVIKGEAYWYVDQPLEKEKERKPRSQTMSLSPLVASILYVIMWVIICAAIGLMIYFVITNLDFGKNRINNKVEPIVSEVSTEKELRQLDYEPLIEKAIVEKDFRLATRWYYLWLLKSLSEQDKIVFNKVRTNNEYKRDLNKVYPEGHGFLALFNSCVRNYEYVWFGNIGLSEQQFDFVQNRFKEGLKNI